MKTSPKEKDSNYDGTKIGGFQIGLTVDNVLIAYHSSLNKLISKRNCGIFYSIQYRQNISQKTT